MREAIQAAKDLDTTVRLMRQGLSQIVPPGELELKAELVFEINRLKREKNAIILGHNYMEAALFQTVPDFVGDSLGLARIAAKSEADFIVFCGVKFMAETAKILNPTRTVLLPAREAGCSLAAAITPQDVRTLRDEFPGAPVVTYVNCYADVKAETDICCTSSNAHKVAEHLFAKGHDVVIFLPDQYLTRNVANMLGADVIVPKTLGGPGRAGIQPRRKTFVTWNGVCEVHELFTAQDVIDVRKQYPDVAVLAHPECKEEVVRLADFSGSTTGIVDYVRSTPKPRYLLLTECSMGDNIIAENPEREVLRLCSHRCPHMAQITLEDTRDALLKEQYAVHLSVDLMTRAKASVDRMIEIF